MPEPNILLEPDLHLICIKLLIICQAQLILLKRLLSACYHPKRNLNIMYKLRLTSYSPETKVALFHSLLLVKYRMEKGIADREDDESSDSYFTKRMRGNVKVKKNEQSK